MNKFINNGKEDIVSHLEKMNKNIQFTQDDCYIFVSPKIVKKENIETLVLDLKKLISSTMDDIMTSEYKFEDVIYVLVFSDFDVLQIEYLG